MHTVKFKEGEGLVGIGCFASLRDRIMSATYIYTRTDICAYNASADNEAAEVIRALYHSHGRQYDESAQAERIAHPCQMQTCV